MAQMKKNGQSFRLSLQTASKRFSDSVESSLLSSLSGSEIERQELIFELMETEGLYLRDLKILIESYLQPLRSIISSDDVDILFSNIEALSQLSTTLFQEFKLAQQNNFVVDEVGKIFLKEMDRFRLYCVYCSNQPFISNSIKTLKETNSRFSQFLEDQSTKHENRNLLLVDFLIMPVQRICKYPLILKELLKSTPESHVDYQPLLTAHDQIKNVVRLVNEHTRKLERIQISIEVENCIKNGKDYELMKRQLVRRGESQILLKKKFTDCSLVLFEDLFLVIKEDSKHETKKVLEAIELVSEEYPADVTEEGTAVVCVGCSFGKSKSCSVKLYFKNESEQTSWVDTILQTLRPNSSRAQARRSKYSRKSVSYSTVNPDRRRSTLLAVKNLFLQ
eukprot:TRINITY_DN1854_c0_g1_i1.p1 TRINITY_DN1854_c0_g1~~TRINITY_DN1854_c0_g1_i1.p1  ORF type:complete len:392 (-),score=77.76 TRINITY_DN1854_c0_g1_i1:751-1926(-)